MRARLAVLLLGLLVTLGVGVVALCLVPLRPARLDAHPDPATSYADGMARLATLAALDGPEVSPACRTRVYTHGNRTGRVIVCLHGLSNCPAQFDSLAKLLFARGDNVIVPRLPLHGFRDRMTPALARLEPVALCAWTDHVIDAADGLGTHVEVVGLSLGGTMAAWSAQERDDVSRVVLVAPMLGLPTSPGASIFGLTRVLAFVPNAFVWWDPRKRDHIDGPPQVYPRVGTRAVACALLVAARVRADAERQIPGAHAAWLVTLAHDPAVDNGAAHSLITDWRLHGVRDIRTHEFPDGRGLSHDLVDPRQVGADPGFVYPVLLEALAP